jgi:4-amino-4-deoxy-L-arabinose transferase-like glycosyltransferase
MPDELTRKSANSAPFAGLTSLKLVGLLFAVFLWRFVLSGQLNLLPDECSYWTWSRRLDWSYFDNSGLCAYLIRLSTELFDSHKPAVVRAPFYVLSILGTFLIHHTYVLLFGDRVRALVAALAVNLTPMALLAGSAAVHDNALGFFWIAALWAATRLLRSRDQRWFYVLGVCSGMALQSKYTGALIPVCALLFLLWTPELRPTLLTRAPWVGAALAGVFALPILWWNANHDWASLHHILFIGGGAPDRLKRVGDGLGYHAAQFLLVSPLFYLAVIAALGVGLRNNLRKPKPEETLLLSFSTPLLLFGVMAFKGHVEANWGAMGYISAIMLATELVGRAWNSHDHRVSAFFTRARLRLAATISLGMTGFVVLHGFVGLLPASLEKRLGKADRILWETRGWDGLGVHVAGLFRPGDIIAADTYQLCALLEYNVPGNPEVRYLAPWNRPTQFDVWNPSYENLRNKDVIFVSARPLVPSSKERTTIYEHFRAVEPLPPYETMYHGVPVRLTYVHRGLTFNPDAPHVLPQRSLKYLPQ